MKNPAYIRSDKGTQIATIIIYTVVACDKKSKFMMVYVLLQLLRVGGVNARISTILSDMFRMY